MTRDEIREVIKVFLEKEFFYTGLEITDDQNLIESIYIDSLNAIKVILFIEQRFNIELSALDIETGFFSQLRSMTDLVHKRLTNKGDQFTTS